MRRWAVDDGVLVVWCLDYATPSCTRLATWPRLVSKSFLSFLLLLVYRFLFFLLTGKLDMVVVGTGTGGTAAGIGRFMKEKCPSVQVGDFKCAG